MIEECLEANPNNGSNLCAKSWISDGFCDDGCLSLDYIEYSQQLCKYVSSRFRDCVQKFRKGRGALFTREEYCHVNQKGLRKCFVVVFTRALAQLFKMLNGN